MIVDIPTWEQFLVPALRVMSDGATRHVSALRGDVIVAEKLSNAQRTDTLPSGQSTVAGRIGWAVSYLTRVDALARPARGTYMITGLGRRLLAQHPSALTELDLRALARAEDRWWEHKTAGAGAPNERQRAASLGEVIDDPDASAADPDELIAQGVERIQSATAAELLHRLRGRDPEFFERAVLKVLVGMGYGGADQRVTHVGGSGDGGVDGVIDMDPLGLDQIYIQAKRYGVGNTVGRESLQAFVGALHGRGASRGVFITTSSFTSAAQMYAASVPTRVALIDGQRLAELMIRYGVGVQVTRRVEIVEVDEDFFE